MEDVTLCDLSRHVFVPRIAATRAVIWRWLNSPTLGELFHGNTASADIPRNDEEWCII